MATKRHEDARKLFVSSGALVWLPSCWRLTRYFLFGWFVGWLVSLSVLKKRNNGPTGLSDRLGVLVSAAFFANEGEAQGGWPPSTVSFPTERRELPTNGFRPRGATGTGA